MNDQLLLEGEDRIFHSRELHNDNTPFLNLTHAPEACNTDKNELPDLLGARNLEIECC